MTTEQLKPCPFCNADMSSFVQSAEGFCRGEGSTLYVPCDCGAMGPEGKTTDDAIAAWNRRTPVQLSAQTAAGLFEKRSMFGPWIEVERPTDKSVPLYTHPAKTEQPETMTAQELADRIRAGEKWKLAETEQPSLSDAQIEEIASWLDEASDDIDSWGGYASDYFAEKWNLSGAIQSYKDRASKVRTLLSAQRQDSNKDAELIDEVNNFLHCLDDYPEQLVPINRNSAMIRALRKAVADIANGAPK